MKIDNALVLAAGKGTRMGEIGKVLPKVLWPIFEKAILELEIEYARGYVVSSVFVNTHHYTKELQAFFNKNNLYYKAELIEENEKLDIGGAIHNLARHLSYKGNLLVINSDQFLMLTDSIWSRAIEGIQRYDGILFTTTVNSNEGYNQILTNKESLFEGIKLNKELGRDKSIETYIGSSIVKLSALKPVQGLSKFFDSVANPQERSYLCINVDECTYWDFGTLKQYYQNMFKVLNSADDFIDFLISNKALDKNKIEGNSYFSSANSVINLSNDRDIISENKIIISGKVNTNSKGPGVQFKKIFEPI